MGDDTKNTKSKIAEGARAVGKAAKSLLRPAASSNPDENLDLILDEIDQMDKQFQEEDRKLKMGKSFVDVLKNRFSEGDAEVRVMQIGPNGTLIDVTEKVNPKDLRPEQIEGVQTEEGIVTVGRGQNREAAMRELQRLLPTLKLSKQGSTTEESIRRMELVLAESDKILNHWKD